MIGLCEVTLGKIQGKKNSAVYLVEDRALVQCAGKQKPLQIAIPYHHSPIASLQTARKLNAPR